MSGVRNQHKQQFGNFGSQRNGLAITHQNTFLAIPAKRTKRIEVLCLQGHTAVYRTFGRILPDFGKDFQTATELGFALSGIECAALEIHPAHTFYPKFAFR